MFEPQENRIDRVWQERHGTGAQWTFFPLEIPTQKTAKNRKKPQKPGETPAFGLARPKRLFASKLLKNPPKTSKINHLHIVKTRNGTGASPHSSLTLPK